MNVKSNNMTSEQLDLMCFLQNFMKVLKNDHIYERKLPAVFSRRSNTSNVSLDYKARAHNRLIEITNNISKTIVESCSGIDEICNKVRACLEDAQSTDIYQQNKPASLSPLHEDTRTEITKIHDLKLTNADENNSKKHEPKVKKDEFQPFITFVNTPQELGTITKRNIVRNFYGSVSESYRSTGEIKKNKSIQYTSTTKISDKNLSNIKYSEKRKHDIKKDLRRRSLDEVLSLNTSLLKFGNIDNMANGKITPNGRFQNTIPDDLPSNFSKLDNNLEYKTVQEFRNEYKELIPDVYRKPASTDLYEKLLVQLEMNDSYICFQRLMKHHRKTSRKNHYHSKESRESKDQLLGDIRKKFNNSLWFSQKYLISSKKGKRGMTKIKVGSIESNKSISDSKKMKSSSQKSLMSLSNYSRTSSKCSANLSSKRNSTKRSKTGTKLQKRSSQSCRMESLCKLKITNKAPIADSEKRRLEWMRTKNLQAPVRALQCLDILDDLTIRDLQPIQSEYPRKDYSANEENISRNCYLKKLLQESSQETWQHLLQPSEIHYDEINSNQTKKIDHYQSFARRSHSNEHLIKNHFYSRGDIIKTLQPYLVDPQYFRRSVITVLPVHVYYDNFNVEKPVKDYLQERKTSVPLEECKNGKRAKWITPDKIKMNSKILSEYTSPKTVLPHSFGSKTPKFEKLRTDHFQKNKKDTDGSKIKKTVCLKNQINKNTKKIKAEIEEKSKQRMELHMNDAQRKLWANKYGKTTGKQLIDFIEKQPEASKEPLPKYMMPKMPNGQSLNTNKVLKIENRSIKQGKNIIQNDIEKTIHNIENKMNDILKNPADENDTSESFNTMEKEIADVLTSMKKRNSGRKTTTPPKVTTPQTLENMRENLDILSDELFKKLEKILDEASSISESKSSISSKVTDFQKPVNDFSTSQICWKNQSQSNNEKPSKSQNCVSSFTAITEKRINEQENTLTAVYGDQKLLDTATTSENKKSKIHNLLPNSRGDYCEIIFDNKHNELIENKKLTRPSKDQSEKTNNILDQESPKEVIKVNKNETRNINNEELLLKQIEFQRHIKAIETLDQIIKSDDNSAIFAETNINPIQNVFYQIKDTNDIESSVNFVNQIENDVLEKLNDDNSKNASSESDDTGVPKDLPGKVNKIIKRVEDIYSQLEEIQLINEIPRFHDSNEIVNIQSDEFLTPFMKDLRNKRNNNNISSCDEDSEEIPSQDITNLLESIHAMNHEKPKEEHIAELHHLPLTMELAEIKNVGLSEHTINTEINKASCLKKSDEDKVKKKVSFSVVTEEKSSQVHICPHHRIKTLKTSSHQFPSLKKLQDPNNLKEEKVQNDHEGKVNVTETYEVNAITNQEISRDIHLENTNEDDNTSDKECVNKDNFDHKFSSALNEFSETSETKSESLFQPKLSTPYILDERQVNVYCDELNGKNPQVVVKNILSSVNNKKVQSRKESKIILFRELSDVSNMLPEFKLMLNLAKESDLCEKMDINKIQLPNIRTSGNGKIINLLKSVYAVVYILMFTALNLEYTCVYN